MTTSLHVYEQSATTSSMNKPRTRGFTIVELLIVIVIIATLVAITIVAFNEFKYLIYSQTVSISAPIAFRRFARSS